MHLRRSLTLSAALLSVGLFLSGAARAQEPGQDEVTLKNGGTVRGTVVSSEPGTSVKIIEAGQKEVRVIPWSQVSDVEKGKYAPAPPPAQPGPQGPGYWVPPPPSPPPQPLQSPQPLPAQMGDPGVVRLHIDSPLPTTLIEQRAAVVGTYYGAYGGYGIVLTQLRKVCSAPCDTVVDGTGGRTFMLTDEQFPAPRPFSFAGMSGDVTVHVDPGSFGRRVGGVLAIVLGASAAVAGAIMIPIAVGSTTTDLNTMVDVNTVDKPLRNAGIGMLAGGLAALGAGVAMVVTGATSVSIEPRGPAAAGVTGRIKPRYWMGEF